jgi:hypothetical protein
MGHSHGSEDTYLIEEFPDLGFAVVICRIGQREHLISLCKIYVYGVT